MLYDGLIAWMDGWDGNLAEESIGFWKKEKHIMNALVHKIILGRSYVGQVL